MGFWSNLFGGNKQPDVEIESINFTENGVEINGTLVDIPTHLSALAKLLGKPRAIGFETDDEIREFLEKSEGAGMVTKRVNYAWDNLGLLAYTHNGTVVNCFSVQMKPSTSKNAPRGVFGTNLRINGEDWFSVMKSGKDGMFLAEYRLGNYKIISEKSDFQKNLADCSREDFNCVDIQLYRE